jgi:hypothetical protein
VQCVLLLQCRCGSGVRFDGSVIRKQGLKFVVMIRAAVDGLVRKGFQGFSYLCLSYRFVSFRSWRFQIQGLELFSLKAC